jgi:hypothetical protein
MKAAGERRLLEFALLVIVLVFCMTTFDDLAESAVENDDDAEDGCC